MQSAAPRIWCAIIWKNKFSLSGELLKKLGFTYEGIEYKAMRHAERGPTDLVCYYLEK